MIEDKDKVIHDFLINDNYIFIWDHHKIKYWCHSHWCVHDNLDLNNCHFIDLKISSDEKT